MTESNAKAAQESRRAGHGPVQEGQKLREGEKYVINDCRSARAVWGERNAMLQLLNALNLMAKHKHKHDQ